MLWFFTSVVKFHVRLIETPFSKSLLMYVINYLVNISPKHKFTKTAFWGERIAHGEGNWPNIFWWNFLFPCHNQSAPWHRIEDYICKTSTFFFVAFCVVINGHLLLTNDYTYQARHQRAVIELVSYHCINITTLAPPNNVLKLYFKHYQLLTPVF